MSEAAKIKNLWGDLPVEEFRTPHVLLREQAAILTEATDGLLVGKVIKEKFNKKFNNIYLTPSKDVRIKFTEEDLQDKYTFTSRLEIIVPSINNYSISIAQIDYPLKMYPLRIMSTVTDDYQYHACKTEDELNKQLAEILSSSEVKRIIAGLLTEIRAEKESERSEG